MADQQIFTLALSVVLPLCALIYGNSRITEAKETLRAEMATLRAEIMLQFERLSTRMAENQRELLAEIRAHQKQHH